MLIHAFAMRRSRLRSLFARLTMAFSVAVAWSAIETSAAAAAEPSAKTAYSFKGSARGSSPSGAMVLDAAGVLGVAGALYGTTEYGGRGAGCESTDPRTDGCGTIYRLSPPTPERRTWLHEVLYSFAIDNPPTFRGNKGIWPQYGLVLDAARKALYGSTRDGGGGCPTVWTNGCGTIFELKPPATAGERWRYTPLHRFAGGTRDGVYPIGDLLLKRGVIYGVTEQGGLGSFGYGTVFQLTRPGGAQTTWTHKMLHKFKGGRDGATPKAGLAFGPNGSLYGTTNFGGGCNAIPVGCGVVYRLLPPGAGETAWTEEVIFRFKGGGNGHFPVTGVAVSSTGVVVGTTRYGGEYNFGILFSLKPPATTSDARAGNQHDGAKLRDETSFAAFMLKEIEQEDRLYFKLGKGTYGFHPDFAVEVLAVDKLTGLDITSLRGWNSPGASGSGAQERAGPFYAPCDNCNADGKVLVYGPSGRAPKSADVEHIPSPAPDR